MKVLTIIFKVLLLAATGVCALVFNILGAISMLTMGVAAEKGIEGIMIFWLLLTVVFFIPPAFLAMFKKYIIGAGFSIAGFICVLILNGILGGVGNELYLQLVIITIISILLAIFGSWDKIQNGMEEREKKKSAVAPSVLGGTTKASGNKSGKKK